jgi:hypothetical protein
MGSDDRVVAEVTECCDVEETSAYLALLAQIQCFPLVLPLSKGVNKKSARGMVLREEVRKGLLSRKQ